MNSKWRLQCNTIICYQHSGGKNLLFCVFFGKTLNGLRGECVSRRPEDRSILLYYLKLLTIQCSRVVIGMTI
jgi:hypothetical protein